MEQRVSVKKTVAVRLEQELVQAHLAAGRAPKRRADSSRPAVSLPVSLWNLQVVCLSPQQRNTQPERLLF